MSHDDSTKAAANQCCCAFSATKPAVSKLVQFAMWAWINFQESNGMYSTIVGLLGHKERRGAYPGTVHPLKERILHTWVQILNPH